MATTETYTRFESARADRFAGFIGGLTRRWAQYKTYRSTLAELETLGDHELADLGIHRSMIRSIAYKAAYDG